MTVLQPDDHETAPRVSICIPTVRRLAYLREALSSAKAQTYRNFEVVLSDNSGDASYAADVDRLAEECAGMRLRVLHQRPMLDIATHANVLVSSARGEYWLYLPDDDRLRPDFLAVLVPILDAHPDLGFAFSDHSIISANGASAPHRADKTTRRYGRNVLAEGLIAPERLPALALQVSVTLQATLFRRDVVRMAGLRSETALVADFDLLLRIACDPGARPAYYCPRRLVEYRLHGDQVTHGIHLGDYHRAMILALEGCSVPPDSRKKYQQLLAAMYVGLALHEASESRGRNARAAAWKALGIHLDAAGLLVWASVVCLPASAILALRQLRRRILGRTPPPMETA